MKKTEDPDVYAPLDRLDAASEKISRDVLFAAPHDHQPMWQYIV
jgi:hypothetical protein